ncbi:MAG TPA: nucleotidyltransferase domain-containing protein [Candidatus Latescibacteria bacterium]|nr:nucleotidyltransferase domain-containing protein [Candidatus Latescibacterota bacterium]
MTVSDKLLIRRAPAHGVRLSRHKDSDIDIAVLLSPKPENVLEHRIELSGELENLFHKRIDLIVLNASPLLLQFQVIKKGRLLFERDPEQRAFYQMRLMSKYYDYQRYFDYHAEHLKQRIKETGLGVGSQAS